jgi:hypothetical protein
MQKRKHRTITTPANKRAVLLLAENPRGFRRQDVQNTLGLSAVSAQSLLKCLKMRGTIDRTSCNTSARWATPDRLEEVRRLLRIEALAKRKAWEQARSAAKRVRRLLDATKAEAQEVERHEAWGDQLPLHRCVSAAAMRLHPIPPIRCVWDLAA